MSGVQWGDVGTWVGGLATAGGLAFTGLALRAQLGQLRLQADQVREADADRRRVNEEHRQSQASMIAAWAADDSIWGQSTQRSPRDAFIRYRNASESPAWEGVVTVDTSALAGKPATIVRTIGVIPPATIDELVLDVGAPVGDLLLPVEITFRDANGILWCRTAKGHLSEVNSPASSK
jgi:hypothetical protein